MAEARRNLRIELDAVNQAAAWSERFEIELRATVLEVAADADLISIEHYRKAAPIAVARLLQIVTSPPSESTDAERRAA